MTYGDKKKFHIGDRVIFRRLMGTVVKAVRNPMRGEIPVKWDRTSYYENFEHSLPTERAIRVLTPLEEAML